MDTYCLDPTTLLNRPTYTRTISKTGEVYHAAGVHPQGPNEPQIWGHMPHPTLISIHPASRLVHNVKISTTLVPNVKISARAADPAAKALAGHRRAGKGVCGTCLSYSESFRQDRRHPRARAEAEPGFSSC